MKATVLLLILGLPLAVGCASSGGSRADLLSGEAAVEEVLARAHQAARARDYRAAVVLYHQVLKQEPSADVWYLLGMSLTAAAEPERAVDAFQAAVDLDPGHRGSLERLALYFTAKSRVQQAMPHLERLVEVDPENWLAHNAQAVLADVEGRFDDAAGHYAAAFALNPDSPMLWNNLGYSHYLAGDHDTAMVYLLEALRHDPDYAMARYNVALVLARSSRYEDAVEMMMSVAEEADAYADVGYLALKMHDYAAAERLLTRAARASSTYHRRAHRHLAAAREALAAQTTRGAQLAVPALE